MTTTNIATVPTPRDYNEAIKELEAAMAQHIIDIRVEGLLLTEKVFLMRRIQSIQHAIELLKAHNITR